MDPFAFLFAVVAGYLLSSYAKGKRMSYPPVEHDVLSDIYEAVAQKDAYKDVELYSECVEFFDEEEEQWYEIVVRPVDCSLRSLDDDQADAAESS